VSHGPTPFARVYEEHSWRVLGFFGFRVEPRELAEDLTQVTFERALRGWSRFDPRRGSEAAWLIAIARNVLIDHQRRDRTSRLEPLDGHKLALAEVRDPEERFAKSTELLAVLANLSERDREVIALRFRGDLKGREIAAMLDRSLASVQQSLSRSLRKLRTMLEQPVDVGACAAPNLDARFNSGSLGPEQERGDRPREDREIEAK